MTDFPKGPWKAVKTGKIGAYGNYYMVVRDRGGRTIASVFGKRGEKEAIGALLAASPTLYKILYSALGEYEEHSGRTRTKEHWSNHARDIITKIGDKP